MTKQEFVTASKNVAKYYSGVNLPLSEDSIMEKEGCNFYFFYELPSVYEDDDDNEIDCNFWYSVSNYSGSDNEDLIEYATGIDGRSGDHFLVNYKDWLVEKQPFNTVNFS